MKKILISLLSFVSLAYCAGGCILTQSKNLDVRYSAYNEVLKMDVAEKFINVKYIPVSIEGTRFSELFVGSKFIIDTTSSKLTIPNMEAKIVDIKADKRIKGKPRTGTVKLLVTMNKKTLTVPMRYNYDNGHFEAIGMLKLEDFNINDKTWSKVTIAFSTTIKALLCDVKVEK